MGFRRRKSDSHVSDRKWQEWIESNRRYLIAFGLPSEVCLDESRWSDFLENGHLHLHSNSGFEFTQINEEQQAALKQFLETEYAGVGEIPPLLQWLRHRFA